MNAIARLIAAGLTIQPMGPVALKLLVEDLRHGADVEEIFYCSVSHPTPKEQHPDGGKENCMIFWLPNSGAWKILVWVGHPGPVEDDFICTVSEYRAIADVILAYYFGRSTILHQWVVPLHRHPELETSHVERAILEAETISQADFEQIQQRGIKLATKHRLRGWEYGLRASFLRFHHLSSAHTYCLLRRDAQIAYIVRE